MGLYMFQHSICHLQGVYSVTLLNYVYSVILSVLDPRKCEYLKDY